MSALRVAPALAALVMLLGAPATGAASPPWMNRQLPPDQRAALLEAQMTLPEKVNLVTGTGLCAAPPQADGWVAGDPRLGIPDLQLVGAGLGVSDACGKEVPGERAHNGKATQLPAPIAIAATFDPAAAFQDGAVIGRESRDLGFNVAIGGDVNLARDPRNGRTFEAEGGDPVLAGNTIAAILRGTQSEHIPATIKHYAMNDEEAYRLTQSSDVDERTMRELELRAFQLGVQQGQPAAVMCSYNKVNGTPACENHHMLTDVLKREWGFKGWVMTDWWACAPPAAEAAQDLCTTAGAANAGLDQEQPNATFFGPALEAAVLVGQVPMTRLDDMVHRILRSLFAYGVFDYPAAIHPLDVTADAAVAQRLAEQSAVLLKNSRAALPLDPRRLRSLCVIGAPAAQPSPDPPPSAVVDPIDPDTPLEGIADTAPGLRVEYDAGSNTSAAAAVARRCSAAVVFARDTMGEGTNLPNLSLDGDADRLIAAVARANRRTIVVLETGTAATMPWVGDVRAVLEAWWPGERGGHAIARLLFGEANPSGRLPLTFPARLANLPTAGSSMQWPGSTSDIHYSEGLDVDYRWYDAHHIRPLFPFGYGLGYGARCRFSAPRVSSIAAVPRPVAEQRWAATLSFTVTNAGTRRAACVPEVFASLPASTQEPPRRLVAYRKLLLRPGQRARVHVSLTQQALDYWAAGWQIAPGRYTIWIGSSSRELSLHRTFAIR